MKLSSIRVIGPVFIQWNAAKKEENCKTDTEFAEKLLSLWYENKVKLKRDIHSAFVNVNVSRPIDNVYVETVTSQTKSTEQVIEDTKEGVFQAAVLHEENNSTLDIKEEVITTIKTEIEKECENNDLHESFDYCKDIEENVVKVGGNNDINGNEFRNRSKSQRVLKRGFRQNYAQVEWKMNDSNKNCNKDMGKEGEIAIRTKISGNECKISVDQSDEIADNRRTKRKRRKSDNDHDADGPDFKLSHDSETEQDQSDNNNESSDDTLLLKDLSCNKKTDTSVEKIVKPRQRTKNRRPEKKPWITIKLDDHSDKYTVETVESFERKNRKSNVKEELFSCLVCNNYKCGNLTVFEGHIEQHVNKVLECEKCSFAGHSKVDLYRHRKTCVRHLEGNYTCELCGKCVRIDSKTAHLGKYHGMTVWKCKFCGVMFKTKPQRLNHMREEHPEECQYCESCKTSKSRMSKEQFEEHKASCKAECQCQICGFAIHRGGILLHIKNVHQRIKSYKCQVCPYMSNLKRNMNRHSLIHTGEHRYNCDHCTFSCVQAYQLTSHMRTHTGEKPFKCTLCKYAAAWNVQLKDHLKVHTMETAVKCEQCDILFKNQKCLNMHLKKDH